MNFIIIISDTLRRDHLGCYGNQWISTPNIDRFAAQSLVFDRAYCSSFPTVPNRHDVLTGRFTTTYKGWAPLGEDEVVLPEVLGRENYLSMMVCDCPHLLENGFHYDRGFDGFEWIRGQETDRWKTYPRFPEHPCDPAKIRMPDELQKLHRRNTAHWRKESDRFVAKTMSAACEWLEMNYKQENFFLYVDTFDPHEPWDAPQWYVDMYNPGYTGEVVDYPLYAPVDFLSDSELKHCRALYAGEVTLVDRWVGRVFQKIEDLGLLDDTMVIFTTDHGFLHGEHGIIGKSLIYGEKLSSLSISFIPLYEEINHIPLIVRLPASRTGRCDAIVQPMDIMPTILDLSGTDIPSTVHGKSFADVLLGKKQAHRTFAVSAPDLRSPTAAITVLKDQYAGILYPSGKTEDSFVDKSVDGYAKKHIDTGEKIDLLFDLSSSPKQDESIARNHPQILHQLRKHLMDLLREVGTDDNIMHLWEERPKQGSA